MESSGAGTKNDETKDDNNGGYAVRPKSILKPDKDKDKQLSKQEAESSDTKSSSIINETADVKKVHEHMKYSRSPDSEKRNEINNRPPMVEGSRLKQIQNVPLSVKLKAFDSDNGDKVSFDISRKPIHGKIVELNKVKGSLIYIPQKDFTGNDSFDYYATHGEEKSKLVSISIKVKKVEAAIDLGDKADSVIHGINNIGETKFDDSNDHQNDSHDATDDLDGKAYGKQGMTSTNSQEAEK